MKEKLGSLCVLLTLLATSLTAQVWRGAEAVAVQVNDAKGRPVANARVVFTFQGIEGETGPDVVASDSKGRAVLADLAPGPWQAEVSHPEYLSYIAMIDVRRGKKPLVSASFLEAGGRSLSPVKVKFSKGDNQQPSPILEARQPAEPTAPVKPTAQQQQEPAPQVAEIPTPAPPEPEPMPEPVVEAAPPPPQPEPAVQEPEEVQVEATAPPLPAVEPVEPEVDELPETVAVAAPPEPEPTPEPVVEDAPPPPQPKPAVQEPEELQVEATSPRVPAVEPEVDKLPETVAVAAPPEPEPTPEKIATPEPQTAPPSPQPQPSATSPVPVEPPQPSTAPQPADIPGEVEDLPVAPPMAATPAAAAAALPPPPDPGARVTSPSDGSCPDCDSAEWTLQVSVAAPAMDPRSTGRCGAEVIEAARAAMQGLSTSIQLELDGFIGPVANGSSQEAIRRVEPDLAAPFLGDLAPFIGGQSPCQVVALVLPKAVRFSRLTLAAADRDETGNCAPGQSCSIGDAAWLGSALVERGPSATIVYGLFENRSPDRGRRALLTAYYRPPNANWKPRLPATE